MTTERHITAQWVASFLTSPRADGVEKWRYCDDPAELAAAVAAGVEVQCVAVDGRTWETGCEDSESFRRCMANDCRYRLPVSWSPEPPTDVPTGAERYLAERLADPEYRAAYEAAAPDDLTTRARRHAETHPESRELIEELLAEVTRWACIVGEAPPVPSWVVPLIAEVDPRIWHLDWVPNRPPVPPWPGAVLSGLTDEDGVPTWLAQAGRVRGEQVRGVRSGPWGRNVYGDTVWVEVRAPRAVPGPETERVPWWEARDRLGLAGDPFVEVGSDDEGPWVRVVEGGTKLHSPVDPDGTVEVLKDGDR